MAFTYCGLKAELTRHIVTDEEIDRQMERAAITTIAGFAKICDGAACGLRV